MSDWRNELKSILSDMKPVELLRERRMREELYIQLDDLDVWRNLEKKYGHINHLISEVNQKYWMLGGEMETIPEEAW